MKKILVANRGEIALRIMRSAKEMGIGTVAVYSEADADAPHVRFADEAFLLGPAPSNQSYLLGDKIIALCKECGADAIHPGYGFLSENSAFARKVLDAGIIFIGPSPDSMDLMGGKISAKQAVKKFNVPLVPGTDHAITDIKEAMKVAKEAGYPVLIKASAGGGGKGMRIVENEGELEEQMKRAASEALSASATALYSLKNMLLAQDISRYRCWVIRMGMFCIYLNANVPYSAATRRSLKRRPHPFSHLNFGKEWERLL